MTRVTSRIRPVAETRFHETLTLGGFLLSYFAMMALLITATMPFLSNSWSAVWPVTLTAGLLGAFLIVGGLFVWPKAYWRQSE